MPRFEALTEGDAMASPPLNVRERLSYGVGQTAEGLLTSSFMIFLFFYYNQVLNLSGTFTGTALLLALIFDAVSDPLMGAVSDRTRTRWGRRHPYLFASALPLGLFTVLLFSPPVGLSDWGLFTWLIVFAILARLALTFFSVPHSALGAELTSDYQDRSNIVALRSFFSQAGYLAAMALGFGLFFADSPSFQNGQLNPGAYSPYSVAIGGIMLVTILFSAFGTMSRIPYLPRTSEDPRFTLRQFVSESFEVLLNSNFRAVFLGILGAWAITGAYFTIMLHGYIHYWKLDSQQLFILLVAGQLTGAISTLIWAYLSRFFEKSYVFIIGMSLFFIFVSIPPIFNLLGILPPDSHPLYFPMLVAFWIIACFGGAAGAVSSGSMVADCVDDHELESGLRQEGNFFGVYGLAAKALTGAGAWLGGILLDLIEFPTNAVPGTVAEETLVKLALAMGPFCAIAGLASLVFLRGYRISKARHEKTLVELVKRRAASRST